MLTLAVLTIAIAGGFTLLGVSLLFDTDDAQRGSHEPLQSHVTIKKTPYDWNEEMIE